MRQNDPSGFLCYQVVKHMMGAFEGRCKQLYGTSAFAKRPPAAQKMQTA